MTNYAKTKTGDRLLDLAVEEGGTAHEKCSGLIHHTFAIASGVSSLPIKRQRPAELQILAHQFARGRRRRHPLELLQQPHLGGHAAAERQPRPAGRAGHVCGQKARLVLTKEADDVRVGVVRPEFDACLDAAQHDRVHRLHDVAAGQHVVAGLLVEEFDDARVSGR